MLFCPETRAGVKKSRPIWIIPRSGAKPRIYHLYRIAGRCARQRNFHGYWRAFGGYRAGRTHPLRCGYVYPVGTAGGMQPEVLGGDLVIATGAIRFEGLTREYAPVEFPAIADFSVISALKQSAEKLGMPYHLGVVQCKDSFYGQHDPNGMPEKDLLNSRWEAWKRCGALASEMESAALFVVGSVRRVRVGTVLLVLANQTRREMGLDDPQVYDTDTAVHTAVEAMRMLIAQDQNK